MPDAPHRHEPLAVLLTLGEGRTLEYKRTADAIEDVDLVAFANTEHGGLILAGVDEAQSADGRQCGTLVGCDAGDGAQQKITNRARQCIPPVEVQISAREQEGRTYLSISIPPSQTRPHCTPSGKYLIRSDTGNTPLAPPALLDLFVRLHATQFGTRFRQATGHLEAQLVKLAGEVDEIGRRITTDVEEHLDRIREQVTSLEGTLKVTARRLRR